MRTGFESGLKRGVIALLFLYSESEEIRDFSVLLTSCDRGRDLMLTLSGIINM